MFFGQRWRVECSTALSSTARWQATAVVPWVVSMLKSHSSKHPVNSGLLGPILARFNQVSAIHMFSSCAGALLHGRPMMVDSLLTITFPGGAPLGFLMSVGDAMITGHLPSALPLENHAAMLAAYCTSASEASLQKHTL